MIKPKFMKYLIFSICLLFVKVGFGQTSAEDGIQNSLNDFEKSWNVHDPRGLSMIFAEDADFMNVRGMSAHGRAGIEQFHTKPFQSLFKDSNLKITGKKVRMIRPDLAAVDAFWEMTGAVGADGKEIQFRKGLMNLLMSPTGDKWLIIDMHNMELPSVR